jgi:hypothetical protein
MMSVTVTGLVLKRKYARPETQKRMRYPYRLPAAVLRQVIVCPIDHHVLLIWAGEHMWTLLLWQEAQIYQSMI